MCGLYTCRKRSSSVEDVVLHTYRIGCRFFFRLLLAFEIWKKETYAYETATDLIRFQLHGWAQSSAATDAPLILSQIRETSCIHEYDEYADKCFTVMYSHVYVMPFFFFNEYHKYFYYLLLEARGRQGRELLLL